MDNKSKNQKETEKRYAQKKPKQPRKITASYLRNSGLFYLQRFTASSEHFKSVMLRKVRKSCNFHTDQDYEACATLVDELTQALLKEGHLDDAGYVRGMVTSLRRAGKSRRVIMGKLGQKRVPAQDIEDALNDFDEENFEDPTEAEFHAALKLARKRKLGPYDIVQKFEHDKALAIMGRQGFSFNTCRRVLDLTEDELYDIQTPLY